MIQEWLTSTWKDAQHQSSVKYESNHDYTSIHWMATVKRLTKPSPDKDAEQLELSHAAGAIQNSGTALEKSVSLFGQEKWEHLSIQRLVHECSQKHDPKQSKLETSQVISNWWIDQPMVLCPYKNILLKYHSTMTKEKLPKPATRTDLRKVNQKKITWRVYTAWLNS